MGKKQKKQVRYTVEEKLRILEEARQPNTTVRFPRFGGHPGAPEYSRS